MKKVFFNIYFHNVYYVAYILYIYTDIKLHIYNI